MKKFHLIFASLAIALASNACGSKSSDAAAPAASSAWSDTAMQAIVVNNCATSGCHNGTQAPNYTAITEAAMKADTKARDQVASGLMPQVGSFTAAQRATVAAFYAR